MEIRKLLSVNIKVCCQTVLWDLLSLTELTSVSSVIGLAVAVGLVPSSHTAGPSILTKVLTDSLTTVWSREPQCTAAGGSPYCKRKSNKKEII